MSCIFIIQLLYYRHTQGKATDPFNPTRQMAFNEEKRELAQAMFKAAIQMIKENSFTVPADQAPTADAIAMLVGREVGWNCIEAQEVAYDILEECNDHELAEKFDEVTKAHNRQFDLEQV